MYRSPIASGSVSRRLVQQLWISRSPVARVTSSLLSFARHAAVRAPWSLVGPAIVVVVAAVLRLWNLGSPDQLVFDERYYVKDAYSMLNLGYEGTWPYNADASFNDGDLVAFSARAEFVAHPPLGKWLIGLGMLVAGGENPIGWRISAAIAGILLVVVVMAVARILFHSTVLTVVAGSLVALDGMAIVMSRVAMLDGFLALFVAVGFYFVLLDRKRRMGHVRFRPWLITAAVVLGLATGIKWSGAWFLIGFIAYVLTAEVGALWRRDKGQAVSTSDVIRVLAVPGMMVLVAFFSYVATWSGWLATDGGYLRHWAETHGTGWSGVLSWAPAWAQSLWLYHSEMLQTNTALTIDHPFQASPFSWLLMLHPTPLLYQHSFREENGCGFDECVEAVDALSNPVIWWAAVVAAGYLIYRFVRLREWRVCLILTGVGAGYLPWLLYANRTMFQYYVIAFEPYLILGLTAVIGLLLQPGEHLRSTRRLLLLLATVAGGVTVLFYPIWSGQPAPLILWYLHAWLPGWRGPL